MINVKAIIRGEPDVPVHTQYFEYLDKSDEQIFFNSEGIIKRKLALKLQINVNEALMIYCAQIVREIREHKAIGNIEKNASSILSVNDVMIGVLETLREITFEAMIDDISKQKITLKVLPTGIISDNQGAISSSSIL